MNSSNWLCVSLTLEEELALERQVREVEQSPHREEVNKLCGALVRQNVLYQRIIQQACGHVAHLEMQQFLEGVDGGRHQVGAAAAGEVTGDRAGWWGGLFGWRSAKG